MVFRLPRRLRLPRWRSPLLRSVSAWAATWHAASLIRKITPVYPPLAKQARIQGVVRFTAIIGKDGTIQNLQLVSGHPLLVEAARQAVSQWQYKPTLLNGEPVEVVTQIDVNFTLSG